MPDTGPHVERLVREIPDEVLLTGRPGETCAWFEARGIRPSLAAIVAERHKRQPQDHRARPPLSKHKKRTAA